MWIAIAGGMLGRNTVTPPGAVAAAFGFEPERFTGNCGHRGGRGR
jgi:hypothetical protein